MFCGGREILGRQLGLSGCGTVHLTPSSSFCPGLGVGEWRGNGQWNDEIKTNYTKIVRKQNGCFSLFLKSFPPFPQLTGGREYLPFTARSILTDSNQNCEPL